MNEVLDSLVGELRRWCNVYGLHLYLLTLLLILLTNFLRFWLLLVKAWWKQITYLEDLSPLWYNCLKLSALWWEWLDPELGSTFLQASRRIITTNKSSEEILKFIQSKMFSSVEQILTFIVVQGCSLSVNGMNFPWPHLVLSATSKTWTILLSRFRLAAARLLPFKFGRV